MKKRFRVELASTAYVVQHQYVEADTEEEAKETALALYNDNTWEYDGLVDENVVATAKETV